MNTKSLTAMALFLALIIISGLFAIPLPAIGLPIVLQNMFCMLSGGLLGGKRGLVVVLVFLLLAFLGFPVLAGGRGGAAIFAGPSGSFLAGYALSALLCGLALERVGDGGYLKTFVIYFLLGVLVIDAMGLISMATVGGLGLTGALKAVVVFLPGDTLKGVLAAVLTVKLKRNRGWTQWAQTQ
ncbi:MAG: biotin transporter BioY [Tissierellia bacterium]|nr:biotin transporter BioY [Tissierellia bacterium]